LGVIASVGIDHGIDNGLASVMKQDKVRRRVSCAKKSVRKRKKEAKQREEDQTGAKAGTRNLHAKQLCVVAV